MDKLGIDVSVHNGNNIDWDKVKAAGVEYAILRAGYGKLMSQKDSTFERNYAECKRVGIKVGAYWYSYAMNIEEAKQEADCFLKALGNKQFEYKVFFDIEDDSVRNIGRNLLTDITLTFINIMKTNKWDCGLYINPNWYENVLLKDKLVGLDIWLAHYGVAEPRYGRDKTIAWQYSSSGSIDGINGRVDLNKIYYDFTDSIKANGLNNTSNEQATGTTNIETTDDTYLINKLPMQVHTLSLKEMGDRFISPHFQVKEFASIGWVAGKQVLYSDKIIVDFNLVALLEKAMSILKASKCILTSGYRTQTHERDIGGSSGISQHNLGKAADFVMYDNTGKIIHASRLCCLFEDLGINGIGYIGPYTTHVDTRVPGNGVYKWWGDETVSGFPSIWQVNSKFKSYYDYFRERYNVVVDKIDISSEVVKDNIIVPLPPVAPITPEYIPNNNQTVTVQDTNIKGSIVKASYGTYVYTNKYDSHVKELQSILNKRSDVNPKLLEDGIAGPKTLETLKAFTIEVNDNGPITKWVQERLNMKGYGTETTGNASPRTMASIELFQTIHRLGSSKKNGYTYLGGYNDWYTLIWI